MLGCFSVIALAAGVGIGIFAGWLTGSIIVGIIVGFIATGFLCGSVFSTEATISQATQPQRDKQIINELKKMNEE